ncbi:CREB-binding protein [Galdieria sulphuraria]|uniref:Bromo domain-containing protein n=1 Tax=Galdieria sulphuraria TaxID=130081 RepID=M2Y5U3_GALSU|nr:uncharacterized protein Gasu_14720 [Galdieria sulphuraria]EME31229.1 hypothetical protein Gasu_14720 [Galdieria sulphuraria]GJD07650.1 CREB-binding protein [Galdieria sulphuraria]|eukprot:XP_005707749.1 hypothetical protein Gasu_14720 [Galdieria sulphuraria]
MSTTTINKANTAEHIKNRQLDKERHQRLAEAMDEAVKLLEEAAEAVKQGQWDERLGAVLTALESKEKPSIPFALGSLGLGSVPEALMNEEHKEGVELFRSLLAQGMEEGNLKPGAKEEASPRRQRTRSTNEVVSTHNRYQVDYEKTLVPRLRQTLVTLTKEKISSPFRKPVTLAEAPNYYDIITNPMDLSTMRKKLDQGVYRSPQDFLQDLHLICENAFCYNAKNSEVYKLAEELKKRIKKLMEPILEEWSSIEQVLDETEGRGNNQVERQESEFISEPSRKTRRRNNLSSRDPKPSKVLDMKSVTVECEENTPLNTLEPEPSNPTTDEKEIGAVANTPKYQETESQSITQAEMKLEGKEAGHAPVVATLDSANKECNSNAPDIVDEKERLVETANATSTDSQPKKKNAGKRDTRVGKSKGHSSRSRRRSVVRR